MPISSFYFFSFYNHLLLFTAYSLNTDHEYPPSQEHRVQGDMFEACISGGSQEQDPLKGRAYKSNIRRKRY